MAKSEARLVLKRRGRNRVWYIRDPRRDGGRDRSTGFKQADRSEAEAALEAHKAASSPHPEPGGAYAEIPVSQVLAWSLDRRRPEAGCSQQAWNRFSSTRASFKALEAFWSPYAVGEIGPASWRAYVAQRTRQPSKRTKVGATVSESSAVTELNLLKAEIRRYGRAHGLDGIPEMPVVRNPAKGGRTIKRSELARLLWATQGYVWDAGSKSMRRRDGREFRLIRAGRRPLARLLLLAVYSASDCSCIVRLRWCGDPDGEESFVAPGPTDPPWPPRPSAGADGEAASGPKVLAGDLEPQTRWLIYRLGPDRAPGRLGGMPLVLNHRISAHIDRWRRIDGPSCASVVHVYDDQALSRLPATTFRELQADAGLQRRVTLGDLRHSTARYMAKLKTVTARSSAVMMGMRTSVFLDQFGELDPDFQSNAVRALERRPAGLSRFRTGT